MHIIFFINIISHYRNHSFTLHFLFNMKPQTFFHVSTLTEQSFFFYCLLRIPQYGCTYVTIPLLVVLKIVSNFFLFIHNTVQVGRMLLHFLFYFIFSNLSICSLLFVHPPLSNACLYSLFIFLLGCLSCS